MDAVKIYEEAARKVGRGEINLKEFWKIIRPLRDVEVVRHGRWRHYDDIIEWCDDHVPKFCPNCGADMREDGGDGKAD